MDRRFSVCIISLGLGLAFVCSLTAQTQAQVTSIPSEIVKAETISLAQREQIEQIVAPMLQRLATGSDEQVADARHNVLRLYESGLLLKGTPAFFAALSDVVASGIKPAAESQRMICKVNAMLVASRALTPKMVPIVLKTLEDQTPAVRYSAAKAIASMLNPDLTGQTPATVLDRSQFNTILKALNQTLQSNPDSYVTARAAIAMSRIPTGPARAQTLELLKNHLKELKTEPQASLIAELTALLTVYQSYATTGNYDEAELLAQTGLGYVVLAADELASRGDELSNSLRQQRQKLINIGIATAEFASRPDSKVAGLKTPAAAEEIEKLKSAASFSKWLETQLHAVNLLAMIPTKPAD